MTVKRSDINFAYDDSHTYLPWLVGVMAFLASFLLCLALSIGGWVIEKSDSYSDRLTVNIPSHTEEIVKKTADIKASLQSLEGVHSVRRMDDSELGELLRPWLGDIGTVSDLPVPVVLEVSLTKDSAEKIDYPSLQLALRAIAPGVEIDTQELWVKTFASFSSALKKLVILFAALIIGGMAIMVAFTSRAALQLHAKTVQLLHSIGAEDRYVTKQFQMESLRLVMPGAFIGTALSAIAFWAIGVYVTSLDSAVMPAITMGRQQLILLIVLPLLYGILAWIVARFTVMRQLESRL